MAKFDFDTYEEQHKNKNNSLKQKSTVGFLGSYLKKDGDSIIVRFPYTSTKDFDVETCHETKLSDYKYVQRVKCSREINDSVDTCPLCKDGVKLTHRFLVKAIAYIAEGSEIKLIPVVWDRPYNYARELGGKLTEYGDLSNQLFKIKRTGTGTDTRYSTDIVLNTSIYNPQIYIKDLSSLTNLDPSIMLIRPISKYTNENFNNKEDVFKNINESQTQETLNTAAETTRINNNSQTSNITKDSVENTDPTDPTTNRPRRYTY